MTTSSLSPTKRAREDAADHNSTDAAAALDENHAKRSRRTRWENKDTVAASAGASGSVKGTCPCVLLCMLLCVLLCILLCKQTAYAAQTDSHTDRSRHDCCLYLAAKLHDVVARLSTVVKEKSTPQQLLVQSTPLVRSRSNILMSACVFVYERALVGSARTFEPLAGHVPLCLCGSLSLCVCVSAATVCAGVSLSVAPLLLLGSRRASRRGDCESPCARTGESPVAQLARDASLASGPRAALVHWESVLRAARRGHSQHVRAVRSDQVDRSVARAGVRVRFWSLVLCGSSRQSLTVHLSDSLATTGPRAFASSSTKVRFICSLALVTDVLRT